MSYRSRNKPQTTLEKIRERRAVRKQRTERFESAIQPNLTPTAASQKPSKPAAPIKVEVQKAPPKTIAKASKPSKATTKRPKPKAKKPDTASETTAATKAATQTPSPQMEPTDAVQDFYNERKMVIERIEALEEALQTELTNLDAVDTILEALIPDPTLARETEPTDEPETSFTQLDDVDYVVRY